MTIVHVWKYWLYKRIAINLDQWLDKSYARDGLPCSDEIWHDAAISLLHLDDLRWPPPFALIISSLSGGYKIKPK